MDERRENKEVYNMTSRKKARREFFTIVSKLSDGVFADLYRHIINGPFGMKNFEECFYYHLGMVAYNNPHPYESAQKKIWNRQKRYFTEKSSFTYLEQYFLDQDVKDEELLTWMDEETMKRHKRRTQLT